MNNPEYVKINDKKYKINTDFRVALKCDSIAKDETISDSERSLAIIYLLYGDEGLNDKENWQKLLELAVKYLLCGEEKQEEKEEPSMDFEQDFNYIKASFMTDYKIDLNNAQIHWWDFYTYLNGLTDKCVLNRIREIREYDVSDIKDHKTKEKIMKQKEQFALKIKYAKPTQKQKESADKFYKLTGIKRKE